MNPEFEAYRVALEARMKKGEAEYGDKSWSADPEKLLGELMDELVDVAGWAGILWTRLQKMREVIAGQKSG